MALPNGINANGIVANANGSANGINANSITLS